MGAILQDFGRLEEAEACYRQAVALNTEHAEAHRHLALMKNYSRRDEQYLRMQEIYLDEETQEQQRC